MPQGLKNLPADERPRERLWSHGPGALADAEVLAVLLRSGVGGLSAIDLARQLLSEGWAALARKTAPELAQVRGMGPAKAATILAALEAARRMAREEAGRDRIAGPEDVVRCVSDLRDLDFEEFRVLFLNTKHQVLAMETVFRGGLDMVGVFPREIFRRAVARSAAAVIVVHNHPSGDPAPSPADRSLTDRLEAAGEVLGISVVDHIIIGRNRHVSLHARHVAEFRA